MVLLPVGTLNGTYKKRVLPIREKKETGHKQKEIRAETDHHWFTSYKLCTSSLTSRVIEKGRLFLLRPFGKFKSNKNLEIHIRPIEIHGPYFTA